jgi:copper chaperone CopZ
VFDDITLVSFVPGRLRLKLVHLEPSAELHQRIAALPGINKVEINPTTKSILVKYDQNLFASDRSVVALQQALDRQLSTEERMQLRSLLQSQNSGEALRALAKQLSPREIERIQAMLHHLAS